MKATSRGVTARSAAAAICDGGDEHCGEQTGQQANREREVRHDRGLAGHRQAGGRRRAGGAGRTAGGGDVLTVQLYPGVAWEQPVGTAARTPSSGPPRFPDWIKCAPWFGAPGGSRHDRADAVYSARRASLPEVMEVPLLPPVETRTLPRFDRPLQVGVREARLLTQAPWVRPVGRPDDGRRRPRAGVSPRRARCWRRPHRDSPDRKRSPSRAW